MMQQHSIIRVSIYFGLFATFAAGLIGLGKQSWNLPVLVGFCSILSIVYTDVLKWFTLSRWVVYLAMIAGAGVAIVDFLGDSTSNQIIEVGNLLVYVQLPLMFQRKEKRVFEQWGVFLLLELVVGALVNNNMFYGVLMLPVLAIGCAAMMALAQFTSQLRHNESISESTSLWAKLLHWLGKERLETSLSSGVRLSAVESKQLGDSRAGSAFAPSMWGRGILPLTFSIVVFSVAYFYSLPRLNVDSYQGATASSVGFNESVSLRIVGDLLKNDTPVFRMSLRDNRTGKPYRTQSPPYIRASVSHKYFDGPRYGIWQPGEPGLLRDTRVMRDPPLPAQIHEMLAKEMDSVTVQVVEKSDLGDVIATVAPFSQDVPTNGFSVIYRDWRLVDTRDATKIKNPKRRFSYSTYAFKDGVQNPILPDLRDCLRDEIERKPTMFSSYRVYRPEDLIDFPESLNDIIPFRDKILKEGAFYDSDKFSKAVYLEEYLASGKEFTYTLSLTAPVDRTIDPTVDFLLNKKKGHCQYFATALVMLLRSLEIPSRLVVGFRPSEYNEVGGYFLVQQSHAHVWVEAYFSAEELAKSSIELPSYSMRGAWLRLDATPPGEESNAGGAFRNSNRQTIGMMQELWTEMIINMDKSKQSTIFSLFGESSDGSYTQAWLNAKEMITRIRENAFVGFVTTPSRWFSWQVAFATTILGSVLVLVYRLLLWLFPKWIPKIRLRNPVGRSYASRVDFYNRAIRLLSRVGMERAASQTQQEFFEQATSKLSEQEIILDGSLLARLFYERRFGGTAQLSASDQAKVDLSLESLEAAIFKQKSR